MYYPRFEELPALIDQKLISKRPHPVLPLDIYNYSPSAQFTPMAEWTEAMKDCRGLILDRNGEIVGRPFRKFWNYEQVTDLIPATAFNVWEKLDGSLGIACSYGGELVCATRGSFESEQAKWFGDYLARYHKGFLPSDVTYLFEILYPENRIVVDYGNRAEAVLLAVMSDDGVDLWNLFDRCQRFPKARRYDLTEFSQVSDDPRFAGQEGFVVQWENGFRAKVKLAEYKRLHRLITQCSTRTIWEMMRAGNDTQELLDRVPEEFAEWVRTQIDTLNSATREIRERTDVDFAAGSPYTSRKDFAAYAKQTAYPGILFRMLDGKDIMGTIWKLVEPAWATPFRRDVDA